MSKPTLDSLQAKKCTAQVGIQFRSALVKTTRCLQFALQFTALTGIEMSVRIDALAVRCAPKARQCPAWITKEEVTKRLAIFRARVTWMIAQNAIKQLNRS
jgi:hypothetical protein